MAKYITPAITPFTAEGRIDERGVAALYEHLIAGGVDGILVLGSIGEFFSIPMDENIASAGDKGTPYTFGNFGPVTAAFEKVARKVIELV